MCALASETPLGHQPLPHPATLQPVERHHGTDRQRDAVHRPAARPIPVGGQDVEIGLQPRHGDLVPHCGGAGVLLVGRVVQCAGVVVNAGDLPARRVVAEQPDLAVNHSAQVVVGHRLGGRGNRHRFRLRRFPRRRGRREHRIDAAGGQLAHVLLHAGLDRPSPGSTPGQSFSTSPAQARITRKSRTTASCAIDGPPTNRKAGSSQAEPFISSPFTIRGSRNPLCLHQRRRLPAAFAARHTGHYLAPALYW